MTVTDQGTLPAVADDALTRARGILADLEQRFAGRTLTEDRGDRIAAIDETTQNQASYLALAKEIQAALYDNGLVNPAGTAEFGGRNVDPDTAARIDSQVDAAALPSRNVLFVGLNIVAPAIAAFGNSEQRARFLPKLYSGEHVGCQLFSEPGAGSDLAGAATRAVRDGDDWVITGQKVWTSHAHLADVGEALVRTDPDAKKHAGLSVLMVDMHSPGVTVRPLRQITGDAAFNEVFLDEVRVPAMNLLGEPGGGWKVATASLSSERGSMGGAGGPLTQIVLSRLAALIDQEEANSDPRVRAQIARTVAAILAVRASVERPQSQWDRTTAPVAGSIQKMLMTRALDEISSLAAEALGSRTFVDTGETNTFAWSEFILGVPALHLAGGTDEIQRSLIATRGLGLPREPR